MLLFRTGSDVCTISQFLSVILSIIEISVILAHANPKFFGSTYVLSLLGHSKTGCASDTTISPLYLSAWTLGMLSAALRISAFRELGRMFTFELSIVKDHKLVTTGPYSAVRHPSYTGAIGIAFAYLTCLTTSGSWVRECGPLVGQVAGQRMWIGSWAFFGLFAIGMAARCTGEDQMMRAEFRDQWDEWAGKVSSKLIPGVF